MTILFGEITTEKYFANRKKNAESAAKAIPSHEVKKDNIDELCKKIVKEHTVASIGVDFESRKGSIVNENLKGSIFPQGFDVRPEEYYVRAKAVYTFNASGDSTLFRLRPKKASFDKKFRGEKEYNKLSIEYRTFEEKPLSDKKIEESKEYIKEAIIIMEQTIPLINEEIDEFNPTLEPAVRAILEEKISEVETEKKQNFDINDF
ncbi:MAG: hypothetical protein AAGB24_14650 [Bacteroidota bacterium]